MSDAGDVHAAIEAAPFMADAEVTMHGRKDNPAGPWGTFRVGTKLRCLTHDTVLDHGRCPKAIGEIWEPCRFYEAGTLPR